MQIDADEHSESTEADAKRLALQCLAEHLLAGDLYRATRRIGLRRTRVASVSPNISWTAHVVGCASTAPTSSCSTVTTSDGSSLDPCSRPQRWPGQRLGAPDEVFTPETELRPEQPLRIAPGSAAALASFFELVDTALDEVRRRHAQRSPSIAQLWPEHFDLAFSMSELNVGGSPGDRDHAEPYLYVGPWWAVEGEMWNKTWGMSLAAAEVATPADAVAFYETGIAAAPGGGAPREHASGTVDHGRIGGSRGRHCHDGGR